MDQDIPLKEFFQAYFDCRANKRNTSSALEFELDFEERIIELWENVNDLSYEIEPLDVFITNSPVKREIFAARFRDRIIHHLVVNKLNHLFERELIYDCYSCRKGKGTLFGIKRIEKFIRQCSDNYQKDCWILKIDIKGYFMQINKSILINSLTRFINNEYKGQDRKKVVWLCKKIINNDPTKDCVRKSPRSKWIGLPRSKSLFHSSPNCGLPVGNYTNQVFANFYLSPFDHFMKGNLPFRFYGRYVDDIVVIHKDKDFLKLLIPTMKDFLYKKLKLEMHPKKIYLQHFSKGVNFLGVYMKPWRKYVSKRIKNSLWQKTKEINNLLEKEILSKEDKMYICSTINSYLGILGHSNSFILKEKFLNNFDEVFWDYFYKEKDNSKIVIKD